jgi:hypothetical protein
VFHNTHILLFLKQHIRLILKSHISGFRSNRFMGNGSGVFHSFSYFELPYNPQPTHAQRFFMSKSHTQPAAALSRGH